VLVEGGFFLLGELTFGFGSGGVFNLVLGPAGDDLVAAGIAPARRRS
jgi:hypothetical protein